MQIAACGWHATRSWSIFKPDSNGGASRGSARQILANAVRYSGARPPAATLRVLICCCRCLVRRMTMCDCYMRNLTNCPSGRITSTSRRTQRRKPLLGTRCSHWVVTHSSKESPRRTNSEISDQRHQRDCINSRSGG